MGTLNLNVALFFTSIIYAVYCLLFSQCFGETGLDFTELIFFFTNYLSMKNDFSNGLFRNSITVPSYVQIKNVSREILKIQVRNILCKRFCINKKQI